MDKRQQLICINKIVREDESLVPEILMVIGPPPDMRATIYHTYPYKRKLREFLAARYRWNESSYSCQRAAARAATAVYQLLQQELDNERQERGLAD